METNHMTKIMQNMSIDEAQPKNYSCNTCHPDLSWTVLQV